MITEDARPKREPDAVRVDSAAFSVEIQMAVPTVPAEAGAVAGAAAVDRHAAPPRGSRRGRGKRPPTEPHGGRWSAGETRPRHRGRAGW